MSVVEEMTRAAAHRRDHVHAAGGQPCAEAIEVICLGRACFAACHDCGEQTGLCDTAQARAFQAGHHCGT